MVKKLIRGNNDPLMNDKRWNIVASKNTRKIFYKACHLPLQEIKPIKTHNQ